MNSRAAAMVLVAGLVWACLPPIAAGDDLRSTERLTYRCSSHLARRDITLFGNGTVRVRERTGEDESMVLAELAPEELGSYLQQIGEIDPTDDPFQRDRVAPGVQGDWIESCEMRVNLENRPRLTFSFGPFEAHSLQLSRLIGVAETLAVRAIPAVHNDLPKDYVPRYGDVLIDGRGQRWRALWITEDRRAVEMQGLQQPVRRIVPLDALPDEYVALEVDTTP